MRIPQIRKRWLLSNDGFDVSFEVTVGDVVLQLSIDEAQRLAAELVLETEEVEPARWGRD